MPELERSDGATIHWEQGGEGPLVILAHHLWSHPRMYDGLVAELRRDHRVVTYDPRGAGESSRGGPYDVEADAADLEALAERCGGAVVVIGVVSGFNHAVRVAARRPDLAGHVVAIGPGAGAILPRAELEGSEGLAASESVVGMLVQLMRTDPRSAMRTIVAANNPQLDEEALRSHMDRLGEYLTPEAVLGRVQAWMEDDVGGETAAVGDRLWIAYSPDQPFYAPGLTARVAELFPGAHLEEIAEGPVSRPDLVAAIVRRALAG